MTTTKKLNFFKGQGEECGGFWGEAGQCANDLKCLGANNSTVEAGGFPVTGTCQ